MLRRQKRWFEALNFTYPSFSLFPCQGGIAFVALKGALKVYFRQQQYLIQANRRILNFVEKGDMERNSTPLDEDSGSEAGLS